MSRSGDWCGPSHFRRPHRSRSFEPVAVLDPFGLTLDHDVEPVVPVIAVGREDDPAVAAEIDLLLLPHSGSETERPVRPHGDEGCGVGATVGPHGRHPEQLRPL